MKNNKLKDSLKEIESIINWFDEQEEVDVEAGLEKVKKGVSLIKSSKERLRDLENEFKKVKKGLEKEVDSDEKTD